MLSFKKIFFALLICLIGFGVAISSGALALSFSLKNPIEKVADLQVPLLTSSFSELSNNPVRGKLTIKIISKNSFQGRVVTICDITEGNVILENNHQHLVCDEKKQITLTVTPDNTFSVNLFSGSYFIDISRSTTDTIKSFPARFQIHKGQETTVEITL